MPSGPALAAPGGDTATACVDVRRAKFVDDGRMAPGVVAGGVPWIGTEGLECARGADCGLDVGESDSGEQTTLVLPDAEGPEAGAPALP